MKLATSLLISTTLIFGTSFVNIRVASATDINNSNTQNTQNKIQSVNQPQACTLFFGVLKCS